ncbi:MAG: isoaspartyl peptidase/L-asparaginase [Persicimonas sp.]
MTKTPRLFIHGGAGSAISDEVRAERIGEALCEILEAVYPMLEEGAAAREAVVKGCRLLEDCPLFNAGKGSKLQADGQIRMSAALMDGESLSFSAVVNTMELANPIELAEHLQDAPERVLAAPGVEQLMRELGVPPADPLVERRFRRWIRKRRKALEEDGEAQTSDDKPGTGTIGVVAMDEAGRLAAGTSTGGRGFERPGRVSDSAMPAGNYADEHAAVSCTGVGEDIIDACLAARICVRVCDGVTLEEALETSFAECDARDFRLGAIAVDRHGRIGWGKTSEVLLAAYRVGERVDDLLDLPTETMVDSRRITPATEK